MTPSPLPPPPSPAALPPAEPDPDPPLSQARALWQLLERSHCLRSTYMYDARLGCRRLELAVGVAVRVCR